MKRAAYLSLLTLISTFAADWSQWRGPDFNGSSPEKNLPSQWTRENVTWQLDLPGPGAATPIILGDKVFVSTTDNKTKTLHALCIDRKTGKLLWSNKTGDGFNRGGGDNSNYASPSPIADAKQVIFFYGNGTMVSFDLAGKELWNRSITKDYGDFAFQWTFASTPLLYKGMLYLEILQRNEPVHGRGKAGAESFLLALDPESGKTIWKQNRPSEAVAESLEAYSTPVPYVANGREEIFITGGDCITGHDPRTGKELWRWGTWNPNKITHWRLVPSPVAGGGVVLACAPKGDPVYAVKLGGNGTLDDSAIAWKTERNVVSADVPTPLFYQGDFFIQNEQKRLISRVAPADGHVKWTVELPGRKRYEASPTGADGKIYTMDFAGNVMVVDAAKGEILDTIAMGEPGDDMTRSSISVAHGQLFVRTNNKLFCVGKDSAVALKK
jgi:outer membrane protein assembly factor BamB